ncbi:MAG: APC family permease [Clostridiales Family XIII bacterium]|jgi:amino acid transporter|nr:APC family permease [Clostridiales Family XIII bacterium]
MAGSNNETSPMLNTGERGLKKHNLSTATVVFMVFALCAAGCYGIEDMIPWAGPGMTLIILIVLPFVWGMPFALVASELGSARPQEGGYYKWVQEALGEFWGFQAGWWRTISIYIDNTLYVVLAGGYLTGMFGLNKYESFAFKAAMILLFMWINIRGVKDVGIVTNALSVFVIAAFAMVAVIGFVNWGGNPFDPITAYPIESPTDWIFYIGAGLSIGMWMYSGYESMSTIAGELENPQVIPKATLITVPLIMATYIIPTMAGLSAFKTEGEDFSFVNWGSEGSDVIGYSTVADHFLGPAFGIFFGIVAVIAQCSIYNTYIASGSRGFFALADDNLAPKFMVKVVKKHGVPYIAVISVAVVNLALCMFDFSVLVVVDVFLLVSSYILVYIAAMILRKRIKREDYKFKIPGGMGILRVVCIVPICIAFISFLVNGSDYFIGGMVGIISGPILYFIWKRFYGGLSKKDAGAFPNNPKTGLALGDMKRIAVMFLILTAVGIGGILFLPWYEADWVFPDDYDMTLFGSQGAMWTGIRVATAVSGCLTVLFAVLGRAVEPKSQKV